MPTTDITITAEDLRVHDQEGNFLPLVRDPFKKHQEAYQQRAQDKNIIFQGRQVGMSTWAASRGFLHAVNNPGYCLCLTNREFPGSSDFLFRIIAGFIKSVEDKVSPTKRKDKNCYVNYGSGELQVSNSSYGVVHGCNINFLQLMDFDWWTVDAQKSAIESLAPCMAPDAEVIIHSSPKPDGNGKFKQIWWGAEHYGFTRHFIST